VLLFSLITLILAKDITLNEDIIKIIALDKNVKSSSETVFLDTIDKPPPETPFDFSTKEEYGASILNLRRMVSTEAQNVRNVRILNSNPNEPYTLVTFNDYNVQLVIRNQDLYVVGFINTERRIFWRFNDFPDVTIEGTNPQNLPNDMRSDYLSLSRRAGGMALHDVTISQFNLPHSLIQLRDFTQTGDQEELARAMLRLVILTAEATRFNMIGRDIARNIGSGGMYELGDNGERAVTSWSAYSQVGIILEDSPHSSDQLTTLYNVQFRDRETNTFDRTNLFWLLAVMLNCVPRNNNYRMDQLIDYSKVQLRNYSTECPTEPEKDVVLIGNTYWVKADIIKYVF